MEPTQKNFFIRLDESLDKTDKVIELKEAIGGVTGVVGKALKQPFKHPIAYGLPAGMYTGAAKSPEFKKAMFDDPNVIDKIQKYADWVGMINLGPVPVGDIVDVTSSIVDVVQGLTAKTKERREQQFADASLRALAGIPLVGSFVKPFSKTLSRWIKKLQLPVTAYTFADPIHKGDPFGLKSAPTKHPDAIGDVMSGMRSRLASIDKEAKLVPSLASKPVKQEEPEGEWKKFFKDLLSQVEKEKETYQASQRVPSYVGSYSREVPAGRDPNAPRMVSGRKTITVENRIINVTNKINDYLNEATGKGTAVKKGAEYLTKPLSELTPKELENLLTSPQLSKALQDMPPFRGLRKITRGILSPAVLAIVATGALPLFLASKFGAPEESETAKKDGKGGGFESTQDVFDKMGISPFGYLKGFVPAAAALSSLAQRPGGHLA